MVELVMQVHAGRTIASAARCASTATWSATGSPGRFELMRVFEQLVHNDPPANEQERP